MNRPTLPPPLPARPAGEPLTALPADAPLEPMVVLTLDDALPGRTRVVCKPDSLDRLRASVRRARRQGYHIRPTDHRALSAERARDLLRVNAELFRRCGYHQIQPAVTASSPDGPIASAKRSSQGVV